MTNQAYIQVGEHPITEMITDMDLVQQQIKVLQENCTIAQERGCDF